MWLALTLFSTIAFLASSFGLTRRGFTSNGDWVRAGRFWLVCAALSALIWVWALSKVPPPYPSRQFKRYEAPLFPIPTPEK